VQGLESLQLTKKSTIAVDEKTYMTSVGGVFAAGDAVNKGPDIAIRAIAGGKYAAYAINSYLNGEEYKPELPQYSVNQSFDASVLEGTPVAERCVIRLQPAKERKSNFTEAAFTLSKEEAAKEAARCLECGCASVYACELLPLARAYGAFDSKLFGQQRQYPRDKSHPFIVRDNSKCILCGQCVRACKEIFGAENLGLFGRGFGTLPQSAFNLPLSESKCVSCGACVNVCPTGALTSRVPTIKNPPLPFNDEQCTCKLCERNCRFIKRSVNGRVVKMVPVSLAESCSLGVFYEPLKQNLSGTVAFEQGEELKRCLLGSLRAYKGANLESLTLEQILNMDI
jgi:formate dehydrogenase major subunit